MTFPKTLAASDSYDSCAGEDGRILDFIVTNHGPGIVYHGDIPPPSFQVSGLRTYAAEYYFDVASLSDARRFKEGMGVEDPGNVDLAAGTVVVSVDGTRIHTSHTGLNNTTGVTATVTAPAISETNGHPIAVGETKYFSSAADANRNQSGRRLVADAAGAVLTITKTRG